MIGTDARFIGVAEQKPLVTFNQAGQRQGDIITHIDRFCSQVNADVFELGNTIDTPPSPPETGDTFTLKNWSSPTQHLIPLQQMKR